MFPSLSSFVFGAEFTLEFIAFYGQYCNSLCIDHCSAQTWRIFIDSNALLCVFFVGGRLNKRSNMDLKTGGPSLRINNMIFHRCIKQWVCVLMYFTYYILSDDRIESSWQCNDLSISVEGWCSFSALLWRLVWSHHLTELCIIYTDNIRWNFSKLIGMLMCICICSNDDMNLHAPPTVYTLV